MKATFLLLLTVAAGLACDDAGTTQIAGLGTVGCLTTARVSPASITMAVGDSAIVSASPPSCSTLPVPFAVFWRSSNSQVVSVDSLAGTVRALGAGQATVIALVVNDTIVRGAAAVQVNAR